MWAFEPQLEPVVRALAHHWHARARTTGLSRALPSVHQGGELLYAAVRL